MRGLICCTLVYSAVLLGYLSSLIGVIFGPVSLILGGIAAFLATGVMFVLIVAKRTGKVDSIRLPEGGLASFYPRVWSLLTPFYLVAAASLLAAVIGLVVLAIAAGDDGVASGGSGPLLAPRSKYYLNNHGTKTEVTRGRYLLARGGFAVGWHAFGIFFACIGFHRVLFGRAKDLKQRWEEHCRLKQSGRRRRPFYY